MKYWRGYLVAGIVALITWALGYFAAAHTELIDMVYPYIDRIIMDYLASWSADFAGCLWQTLYTFLIVLVIASGVLMLVLRWNPIQWFGWVLTVFSVISLLNAGIYGLNEYAGPLAEDIRLEVNEYSVGSLERAAEYYRDLANEYAKKIDRNSDGSVKGSEFTELASSAAEGFDYLVYQRMYSVFSGTTVPVKQLGWTNRYDGVTGVTVGITGEAAVNPNVPSEGMPFAICHEMSHRMCIYNNSDADFGAFLACTSHSDPEFIYSGYLMAFRCCYNALSSIQSESGQNALKRISKGVSSTVMEDMQRYNSFFGDSATDVDADFCNLLVSWHIQEVAKYEDEEEEDIFDPMDESDERFQDILG